ncbi:MAG: FHA domain-containing protein [Burkholderiales bacterium]
MEPLAFVEIVDRHKDVLARHAVYRWPLRIGRGYGADVLVDDPFIAPVHLAIAPAEEDRFSVSDLGSLNGFSLTASGKRLDAAQVGPDDLVRVGHTQIRIRTPSYAVSPERPLQATALYRRPAAFMVMAALMVALFLWNAWIMTSDDDDKYMILVSTIGMLVVIGIWISIWSFVSSAIGRRPNFSAHGFVACAGVVALVAASSFFDYLAFGFDAGWVQYIAVAVVAAMLAYIVYRHLLLNSRATRKTLALAGSGISLMVCAGIFGINLAMDLARDGNQHYSESIKPPSFLYVSGVSPSAFMSDAEALKRKVDAMGKRD